MEHTSSRRKLYEKVFRIVFVVLVAMSMFMIGMFVQQEISRREKEILNKNKSDQESEISILREETEKLRDESKCNQIYKDTDFTFDYDNCFWTLNEQSSILSFTPRATNNPLDELKLIRKDITSSEMDGGQPNQVCAENNDVSILKMGSVLSENNFEKGLIRIKDSFTNTYKYSNRYTKVKDLKYAYINLDTNENKENVVISDGYCIFDSRPIFKLIKVDGGEALNSPDTNDIYRVIYNEINTNGDYSALIKADEIMLSLTTIA